VSKADERRRKKHNKDLLRRFYNGEVLQDKASGTWFPPRPMVQKDIDAMHRLYGGSDHGDKEESSEAKKGEASNKGKKEKSHLKLV
jgi:hypothetical protein